MTLSVSALAVVPYRSKKPAFTHRFLGRTTPIRNTANNEIRVLIQKRQAWTRVVPEAAAELGKDRITIRIDSYVLQRFFEVADQTGTGHQTLINNALREYIDGRAPKFEDTLCRIVREEIAHETVKRAS